MHLDAVGIAERQRAVRRCAAFEAAAEQPRHDGRFDRHHHRERGIHHESGRQALRERGVRGVDQLGREVQAFGREVQRRVEFDRDFGAVDLPAAAGEADGGVRDIADDLDHDLGVDRGRHEGRREQGPREPALRCCLHCVPCAAGCYPRCRTQPGESSAAIPPPPAQTGRLRAFEGFPPSALRDHRASPPVRRRTFHLSLQAMRIAPAALGGCARRGASVHARNGRFLARPWPRWGPAWRVLRWPRLSRRGAWRPVPDGVDTVRWKP